MKTYYLDITFSHFVLILDYVTMPYKPKLFGGFLKKKNSLFFKFIVQILFIPRKYFFRCFEDLNCLQCITIIASQPT